MSRRLGTIALAIFGIAWALACTALGLTGGVE